MYPDISREGVVAFSNDLADQFRLRAISIAIFLNARFHVGMVLWAWNVSLNRVSEKVELITQIKHRKDALARSDVMQRDGRQCPNDTSSDRLVVDLEKVFTRTLFRERGCHLFCPIVGRLTNRKNRAAFSLLADRLSSRNGLQRGARL